MEEYFSSLSKRQTMLLLTSLAFGGREAVASFEHLPPEEEELLKHRAAALLQIPSQKRVPLLVQEIKRLVTQRRRQLSSADPRRLAEVLKKEKPATIEVVLRALPGDLAEAVRAAIPNHPTLKLRREVQPEILAIVRWRLEEAVQQKTPAVGTFRFTDLLTLQEREILSVCDRLGARVLATAIAGLNAADTEELLGRLPPDQRALAMKASELATRASELGRSTKLNQDDARAVLEMHGALAAPSAGLRSAGAQRLMRACVAQSPEFVQGMLDRFSGDFGKLLHRWAKQERKRPVKDDGGRLDIVEQLERLAQKGIVDRPMRLPPPFRSGPPPKPSLRPPPAALAKRDALGPEPIEPSQSRDRPGSKSGENPPPARKKGSNADASKSSSDVPRPKPVVQSPAFQAIPRRKSAEPAKGANGKGPGRGPSGGSR